MATWVPVKKQRALSKTEYDSAKKSTGLDAGRGDAPDGFVDGVHVGTAFAAGILHSNTLSRLGANDHG